MSNSYKFSEIVLALRKEYVENQKLLRKLDGLLSVDGSAKVSSRIYPSVSGRNVNDICVDIIKEQNKIKRLVEKMKYEALGILTIGEPYRIVKKDKDNYVLDFEHYASGFRPISKFNVGIIDQSQFNDVVEEIINSDFIKLPDYADHLNSFQFIEINANEISLSANFDAIRSKAFPLVAYKPETDTLIAFPSKGGTSLVIDFLNTRIPRDFIPEQYREMIDCAIDESNGKISQDIGVNFAIKRKSELEFVEKPKSYSLARKRYLSFYE